MLYIKSHTPSHHSATDHTPAVPSPLVLNKLSLSHHTDINPVLSQFPIPSEVPHCPSQTVWQKRSSCKFCVASPCRRCCHPHSGCGKIRFRDSSSFIHLCRSPSRKICIGKCQCIVRCHCYDQRCRRRNRKRCCTVRLKKCCSYIQCTLCRKPHLLPGFIHNLSRRQTYCPLPG